MNGIGAMLMPAANGDQMWNEGKNCVSNRRQIDGQVSTVVDTRATFITYTKAELADCVVNNHVNNRSDCV
jgi:hypothetical protein